MTCIFFGLCFDRVDVNKDSFISLPELEEWIIQKVQEHFDEAHEENEKIFRALDMDSNGNTFLGIPSRSGLHTFCDLLEAILKTYRW